MFGTENQKGHDFFKKTERGMRGRKTEITQIRSKK